MGQILGFRSDSSSVFNAIFKTNFKVHAGVRRRHIFTNESKIRPISELVL